MFSQRVLNPMIPKGFPNTLGQRNAQECAQAADYKGSGKRTKVFFSGKRMPKHVKAKRVEFRLMEKCTSEFKPARQAKRPQI